MTEEEKTIEAPLVRCEFCGAMDVEEKIHEIHPYRPSGWSPTIPYRTRICGKCLDEQGSNVSLASDAPAPVTEEEAEEEEAESPNPMAGATMQERIDATVGAKSGSEEEG